MRALYLLIPSTTSFTIVGGLVDGIFPNVPDCAANVPLFGAALSSMRGLPITVAVPCAANETLWGVLPAMGARTLRPSRFIHQIDATWAQSVTPADYLLVCRASNRHKDVCATHDLSARVLVWCEVVQKMAAGVSHATYKTERLSNGRIDRWKLTSEAVACLSSVAAS